MDVKQVQREVQRARRGALLFTVGALVMTGILAWVLAHVIGISSGGDTTRPVVVAIKEIPAMGAIAADSLRVASWPQNSVPEGAFSRIDEVISTRQIALRAILPGEPLTARRLSPPEHGVGATQLIPPNMRAFAVRVNDALATAELIRPGALVDVISTVKDGRTGESASTTVLQAIEVLAVGPVFDPSLEAAPAHEEDASGRAERARQEQQRIITLVASPQEVEFLTFATRDGVIDLALRNPVDRDEVATTGVNRRAVMGQMGEEAVRKPPPSRVAERGRSGPSIYKVGR